jgi:chromosome segregation protein
MNLKKITMHGFKSFADKTDLDFGDGITVIVGPNGCGKSNVVDAIKWVLGEQSAKSLRGGQMLDVIFNGSANRKSVGMAEVTLHFSNTRDLLNTDQDDVAVTRRLYRSGESEYLLNNEACRLKDIREMFMDTGIGSDTYSLIEQGKVELLLQTNKQERRAIFEEAAGISKYKARRKEAERKLDRTEQNLLRLTDVIDEIEKRLRSIKYQAGKARNYQTYSERLNELRLQKFLYDYKQLKDQAEKSQDRLDVMQDDLIGVTTTAEQAQTRLSLLDHEIDKCESDIRDSENFVLQCTSQITNQQDRIESGHKRGEELAEQIARNREQVQSLRQKSQALQEEIASDREEIAQTETRVTQQEEQLDQLQESHQDNALKLAEYRAQLEDEKSGLIDIVRRTAQLHNEINSFDIKRSSLTGQTERLRTRSGQISDEIGGQLTERAGLEKSLTDVEALLAQSREQLESKQQQLAQLDQQRVECTENLSTAKEHRSGLVSRKQILEDLEAKLEGLDQGVKRILQQKDQSDEDYYYVKGIVAQLFQADVAYASIVDAALSHSAQHLVAINSQAIMEDHDSLQELPGRVQIICLDRLPAYHNGYDFSRHPEVQAKLIDLVSYTPDCERLAWHLLGKTILVESLDAAFRLAQVAPAGYRWVTPGGEVLEADGTVHVGPATGQVGLISRKSELRQIDVDMADVDERVRTLQNQNEQMVGQAGHLDKNLQELRTSIYENNTEQIQIRSRIDQIDNTLNRLKQEQPLITTEISAFEEQIAESLKLEEVSQQRLVDLEEVNTQRQTHIDELDGIIQELSVKEQGYQETITELKVSLGQTRQKRLALHDRIQSVETQIQQFAHNVKSLQTDIDNGEASHSESQRAILTAESAITELFQNRQQRQEQAQTTRQQRDSHQEEKDQLLTQARELHEQREKLQESLHSTQMKLNETVLRQENLAQRATEEIGLDLEERYQRLFGPDAVPHTPAEPIEQANEQDTEEASAESSEEPQSQEVLVPLEELDWEAVATEIEDLKQKIARLGNVNLDAITEQEELEERSNYLNSQATDLQDSMRQLQQLIDKLNETSKQKFEENFDRIRENFSELFRKLFGGGKAEIILEDPENILECDIEIIARPPGKQPQSISLLSGGEKTMTAVSLLLAIFKSKPSPFCILDEADAALDEANNERYNLVLKEFLADSQFIVITHSRRTMSIADVIYGVTMQEQGVSKKVSVRFADYDEIMEGEPEHEGAVA